MSEFGASPRSSKRRKIATYGSNRPTATSPILTSPSVLRSLSNAVPGISRRLFEAQTNLAAGEQVAEPDDRPREPSRESKNALQKPSQADEEEEVQYTFHVRARTERMIGSESKAVARADVVTPAGKITSATRPEKGSMGDTGSQKRSSTRRARVAGKAGDKSSLIRQPIRSFNKQETNNLAYGTGRMAEQTSMKVALTASSSDSPGTLLKKRMSRIPASASSVVVEEPVTTKDAENDGDKVVANQRSSGREKRKPRRYSADVEDMAEQHRKQLVGTQAPLKRDRARARRSTPFEDDERQFEEQLKSKDLEEPSLAKGNAGRKRKARSLGPKVAPESGLVDLGSKAVPFTKGDGWEVNELGLNDAALPDTIATLDQPRNATHSLDLQPEADEDPCLTTFKARVISRLTNSSRVPLTHLAHEYGKVRSLLEATITAGEGNSILLLGARGSGKTNLIETALADVGEEYAEDFHVVRLNGFQQTDDKIALREIWRQLGREMRVEEDEMNQVSSYADTMASLLHLLSHPEELAEVLEPDALGMTTKSVIFVLDEFDLFAAHPRQTLLYNLFDIAQAKKAPIAVIGCSTRVDVAESLEKRVKSRFSHRWIHLSHPKSFRAFEAVIEAALCLEVPKGDVTHNGESSSRAAWNEYMKSTFIPSMSVQALLRQTFYTTKSIAGAFTSLNLPVASITSLDHPFKMPLSCGPLTPPDSPLQLLPSLSALHLYLLISAARLDAIHNASVVNFNLVYHHHVELASRSRLQSSASGALAQGGLTKIWGRETAKGAWEELGDWEIIVPAALGKGKGDDAPETRMWRVDVTLEEISACVGDTGQGVSELLARWCKEV